MNSKGSKSLPIWEFKDEFIRKLEHNKAVIINGKTGSGKSSQVPQWCLEYCKSKDLICQVACTQPRRLTAYSLADFVAKERNVILGEEVGYSIRFEENFNINTKLKYLTDGKLLNEAIFDPQLSNYSVIVLDEIHERSLHTDILLGILKKAIFGKSMLKVVLMSATLETDRFSNFFYNAAVINVPGRLHPLEIEYSDTTPSDYENAAKKKVVEIIKDERPGNILVFVTGVKEVYSLCDKLEDVSYGRFECCPLYASATEEDQEIAISDNQSSGICNRTKVIVCTNVAETSITIPNIKYVVDTGKMKQKVFNHRTKLSQFSLKNINQANAEQRAGRAGRTCPGKCFRLYSKNTYERMEKSWVPEILRLNLDSVILILKRCGIDDIKSFEFLDRPDPESLRIAELSVMQLSALNKDGSITQDGYLMAEMPVDPPFARAIISSTKYNCCDEIAKIVSLLCVSNLYNRRKNKRPNIDDFKVSTGDHETLLKIFDEYESRSSKEWCNLHSFNQRALNEAVTLKQQIISILKRHDLYVVKKLPADTVSENIRRSILSGFPVNVATLFKSNLSSMLMLPDFHTSVYKTINGHPAHIDRSSTLNHSLPNYVVYLECFSARNRHKYLKSVSKIEKSWISHPL